MQHSILRPTCTVTTTVQSSWRLVWLRLTRWEPVKVCPGWRKLQGWGGSRFCSTPDMRASKQHYSIID